jgi:branched-chain amino acid transport system permease protein
VSDLTDAQRVAAPSMKVLPDNLTRISVGLAVLAAAIAPLVWSDDFWMTVLGNAGAFAVAAIGLSILTGYTGQVSLGHAALVTIGGYTVGYFGADHGWPLLAWILAALVVGSLIGSAIGPFALRLKGNYLVVVTLALIFITTYVVQNWESVTGGFDGKSINSASLSIGPIDFAELNLFGKEFTREQGVYYLCWILVGITALVARNIVRSRPGRAMQAIRDRDVAAEVVGVSNARYKVAAFAVSSAMAALGGALFAVSVRFISPNNPAEELFLSIRFVAIIIVGGLGTIYGAVLGALLLGPLPELVNEFVGVFDFTIPIIDRPLVSETGSGNGIFTAASFSEILFGVLLVVFLMFAPDGIAGMIRKLRRRLANRRASSAATVSDD